MARSLQGSWGQISDYILTDIVAREKECRTELKDETQKLRASLARFRTG